MDGDERVGQLVVTEVMEDAPWAATARRMLSRIVPRTH